MPDRRSPGSRWYVAAHLVIAAAGLVGLVVEPSPSVREVLGMYGFGWTVAAWSATLTLAGVLAAWARLAQRYYAETAAVDLVAAVLLVWAILVGIVVAGGQRSSLQAALAFVAAALLMHGWAKYRRSRLDRTVAQFRATVVDIARKEAGR